MMRFLHIICGISFFGLIIAAFYYITRSIKKQDSALTRYSINASYAGDVIILLCILIQLTSSIFLTSAGHFTLSVPWIFVAYHAFGLLIVLWLLSLAIKTFYLSRPTISAISLNSFYCVNIIMILIFTLIIHDAVTKTTCLDFLFRT